MPSSFSTALHIGFDRPRRRGERVNLWGSKLNEIADRLDGMHMSKQVEDALREAFEEFGQQMRDAGR